MTRAHFKFMAKHQLRGNVGTIFLASLLFSLAMIALMAIPAILYCVLPKQLGLGLYYIVGGVGSLIMIFYSLFAFPAFNIGYIMMIQKIAKRPSEKVRAREIFRGFKRFWAAFKVLFFVSLFSGLWSLLFVIPGIVKMFSYSQALWVIAENPGMGALEAITRSREIMRGRRFDYYVLMGLSFAPWMILLPLTLGFLGIWLFPYMDLTRTNFYNYANTVPGVPEYGIPTYGEPVAAMTYMSAFGKPKGYEHQNEEGTAHEPIYTAPVEPQHVYTPSKPVEESKPTPAPTVVEAPAVETPVVEEPVAEAPAEETPAVEEPVAEVSAEETPAVEQPAEETETKES